MKARIHSLGLLSIWLWTFVPKALGITPAEVSQAFNTPDLVWVVETVAGSGSGLPQDGPPSIVTRVGSSIEWEAPSPSGSSHSLRLSTEIIGPKRITLTASGNEFGGIRVTKEFGMGSSTGSVSTGNLEARSTTISLVLPAGRQSLRIVGNMLNTFGSMQGGQMTLSGFAITPEVYVEKAVDLFLGEAVHLVVESGAAATMSASGLPPGVTLTSLAPDKALLSGYPQAGGVFPVSISASLPGGEMISGATTITVTGPNSSLARALDQPDLLVRSSGWQAVESVQLGGSVITPGAIVGPDATLSGFSSTSTRTWLEARVFGPATISWHFRRGDRGIYPATHTFSAGPNAVIDPNIISLNNGWHQQSATLGYGQHLLRWTVNNHPFNSLDKGQVDGITLQRPSGFAAWAQLMPEAQREPHADPDADGLTNLEEYAFGSDPTSAKSAARPQMTFHGNTMACFFTGPPGLHDLVYQMQWSESLVRPNWHPVPDSGSSSSHLFTAPLIGDRQFFRLALSLQ